MIIAILNQLVSNPISHQTCHKTQNPSHGMSGDSLYEFLNQMADMNIDFGDLFISENQTGIEESELQSIKFYLEGVAYTPIAIIGIIGRLKEYSVKEN